MSIASVKAQQTALNKQGANLKVDGISGRKTQAAIAKYSPMSNATSNFTNNWGQSSLVAPLSNATSNFTNNWGQTTTTKPLSTATSNFTNNWGIATKSISNTKIPLSNAASNFTNNFGTLLSSSFSSPISSPISSPTSSSLSNNPTGNTGVSNIINTPTLGMDAGNTKITFPEATIPNYSQAIPASIETQVADATKEKDTSLKDYLDTILNEAPNSEDAYQKAQRETQILQKQQLVNDLSGQLNGIVNKGQANQLSLVGQGRGIPEAIIGGQQAQIGRETAIAALPVQAQLSAAQGNLEMANDNLDTLFKIYSDDAKNEYEYKKEVKKAVYDVATAKEKRELEKLDKMEERNYQETKDLNDERLAYSKMAFANGQSSLGAKMAKLDYKSPTFRQDLAQLQSQLKDPKIELDRQLQQAQINNINSQISERNKTIETTINPKILSTTQFKNAQAAQNLKITLQEAKTAVEKYGNYENLDATGKGILDTLKIRLASQISTALEQGVVMPGEMENFQKVAGQLNSSNWLGIPNVRNKKTLGSLDSLLTAMDSRVALQKAAITNTYQVTPEQVDTLLNITDLSDQEFADMDALVE